VDPLAENAGDWTPFRYGFNNPLSFIDPDGQFETKKEARKYRRATEGINWFNSNINKNKDGTYHISQKEGITLDEGWGTLTKITENDKDLGIITSVSIAPNDVLSKKDKVNSSLWGLEKEYVYENTLRDGSTEEVPKFATGTAPVPGFGKVTKFGDIVKNLKPKEIKAGWKYVTQGKDKAMKIYKSLRENGFSLLPRDKTKSEAIIENIKLGERIIVRKSRSGGYKNFDSFTKASKGKNETVIFE
jgi:hypothetical protein